MTPSSATPATRRYGGASAEERSAQRRQRLMQAAVEVFGQHGYRQATMRLVCAQARLADRYFAEHFANIHDCFVAVHKHACEETAQVVEQAILSLPGDLLVRSRGGLTAFFEHIRANPSLARILILDSSASGLSAQNRVELQYGFIIDLLKTRFRQKYPKLPDKPDLGYVVSGCIGMTTHICMLWAERHFSDPIETVVDHAFYFWIGLDRWLTTENDASA